jgi:acyl carrier protein
MMIFIDAIIDSLHRKEVTEVSVQDKVKGIIADQLEVDVASLTMETTFEEIDADSLDIVELVMALEEEFELEISDQEVENVKTVGDVVKFIESKV